MKKTLFSLIFLVSALSQAAQPLAPVTDFGSNPGELNALYLAPQTGSEQLVVLLHGCGQKADAFAEQSGMLAAAKARGFGLLLPQQLVSNNPQLCFNWFNPTDTDKEQGELASIIAMIEALKTKYSLKEVYIAGLSAGGAMVSALITQHPEQFQGAAVVAGISYPCAKDLATAISCMQQGPDWKPTEIAKQLKSTTNASWPMLTVISGKKDSIVAPVNSLKLTRLWAELHQVLPTTRVIQIKYFTHEQYQTAASKPVLNSIVLDEIGHGWPVNSKQGFGGVGAPFMIDQDFSATVFLLKAWNLQ